MLNDALRFWDAISDKVKRLVRRETKNAFRCERYEVTTAPDGTKMGVTLPMGNNEIFVPYSNEVSGATLGDTVLVVWWGSMSNAKAYYFADGYNGGSAASMATIDFPLNWTNSGNGYWYETVTATGVPIFETSKVDLQADASQIIALSNGNVSSIYIENTAGTLTAYSVGAAPTTAMTLQAEVTEAETSGASVIGDELMIPNVPFQKGDTFTFNGSNLAPFAGFISSSTSEVLFGVFVPRSLHNISTVSVTTLTAGIRSTQGYLDGHSSNSYNWRSGYTVTAAKTSRNMVAISIKKSSTMSNATNNTPISVAVTTLVLSFS